MHNKNQTGIKQHKFQAVQNLDSNKIYSVTKSRHYANVWQILKRGEIFKFGEKGVEKLSKRRANRERSKEQAGNCDS